jgi:hypothetical protein
MFDVSGCSTLEGVLDRTHTSCFPAAETYRPTNIVLDKRTAVSFATLNISCYLAAWEVNGTERHDAFKIFHKKN